MRIALLVLLLSATAGAQPMPDLVLDSDLLASTTSFDLQSFAPDACELQAIDRCVGGPGPRALLRFSVFAVNRGKADLVLGVPPGMIAPPNRGEFVYSSCHQHYHFDTFARYELRQRGTATVVAPGQKRSFCVEDTKQADPSAPVAKKYCCTAECGNLQGVQVGWGDLYPSTLACQWIDVTGIAPGDYDLCVFLNTAGLLAEAPDGDSGCVPVTIAPPRAPAPHVKVRAPHRRARVRVGHRLAVAWQRRAPGTLLFQEVWLSRDDGASYDLLARVVPPNKARMVRVPVNAEMVADQARVKVYVCTRNPKDDLSAGSLQCGEATSGPFRIVP
jgi:hypothetical protein